MARVAEDTGRRLGTGKVPPHNLEAEESVLGSMMLSGEAIAEVIETLKPDEFYSGSHQRIFETLQLIYGRGDPVDEITTVEELKRRGVLGDVGGPLRIHDLVERVPTPAGATYYAQIVSDNALLRRLLRAASEIMERAYSVPDDPAQFAEEAEGAIYAASRRDQRDDVVSMEPLISDAIDDIEKIQYRETSYSGLPTGFRDVDEKLSGLQSGNMVILAARPGLGKSSLALNIARNVAAGDRKEHRKPVAVFSLEMSRWEVGMRLLCAEAGTPMSKVRSGKLGTGDWTQFVEAADQLHDAPMFIIDAGNITILDIRAKARRLKSRAGLALIVVDYLQLMSHHRRVDSRQQEIAEISRSLKLLAKELDVPILALSQLNRDPERGNSRPQLANLRESGALEQDADVVLFIHREKGPDGHWTSDTAELMIAKHRNGPTGTVELHFKEELMQFRSLYKQ